MPAGKNILRFEICAFLVKPGFDLFFKMLLYQNIN